MPRLVLHYNNNNYGTLRWQLSPGSNSYSNFEEWPQNEKKRTKPQIILAYGLDLCIMIG